MSLFTKSLFLHFLVKSGVFFVKPNDLLLLITKKWIKKEFFCFWWQKRVYSFVKQFQGLHNQCSIYIYIYIDNFLWLFRNQAKCSKALEGLSDLNELKNTLMNLPWTIIPFVIITALKIHHIHHQKSNLYISLSTKWSDFFSVTKTIRHYGLCKIM